MPMYDSDIYDEIPMRHAGKLTRRDVANVEEEECENEATEALRFFDYGDYVSG